MSLVVVGAEIKLNKTCIIPVYETFTTKWGKKKKSIVSNCDKFYAWNKWGVKAKFWLRLGKLTWDRLATYRPFWRLAAKLRPNAEGAGFERVGGKTCRAEFIAWASVWRQKRARVLEKLAQKMLSEQIVGERMKMSSGCSCLYLAEPNRHG